MAPAARIIDVSATAYRIPTERPEADGTLAWTSTTLVVASVEAGGMQGVGYTYADATGAALIRDALAPLIRGADAFNIPACFAAMRRGVRNLGRGGLVGMAVSAVDAALWDLKARLLDIPLVTLLGAARPSVPIYGSGGFTSDTGDRLREQLAGCVARDGCRAVKMKIGTHPEADPERMELARDAIGEAELFIDANGALSRKQALAFAELGADLGVTWFEEPVSGDDLAGLRLLRDRVSAPVEIVAGEYVGCCDEIRHMLEAGAVDVQQADASRCGGVTGFLAAGQLCDAHHVDLSAHCAPALHLHVACAVPRLRNLEWFHDHVRIEAMLFDGAPKPAGGEIRPDLSRPGLGLDLKADDAARYEV